MTTQAATPHATRSSATRLVLAVTMLAVAACTDRPDGGNTHGNLPPGDAGTSLDGSVPSREVLFPQLLPELAAGMYWDVAAYYHGNFSGFGFIDHRGVRLTLGRPRALDGHEAFPVAQELLWAVGNAAGPWSFAYSHLAVDETRLWGRFEDGSGWTVLLDTYGTWTGSDPFFPGDEAVRGLAPHAMDTVFVDDPAAIAAYRYVDAANCTFYAELGQTICDDGSSGQVSSSESVTFFKSGVGFYGHSQNNVVGGGSGEQQLAVIAHGIGAPACGTAHAPANTCSRATRRCIETCETFECARNCAEADPDPACFECAHTRIAGCAASAEAARGQKCCLASVADSAVGCPSFWDVIDESASCLTIALIDECAGLSGHQPSGCPSDRPQRCERRGLSDCFAADTNCASVVDCAGVGGHGITGCSGPSSAVDCATSSCLPALDPEASDATCSNQQDDDGNGFTDCRDFSCSGNPLITVCGNTEVSNAECSDGVDNDDNGFTDCADFNCLVSPSVSVCNGENTPALCGNGMDDNDDGRTDCGSLTCSANGFVECN